jgi:hypothetical protein
MTDTAPLELTIYELFQGHGLRIVPAPASRDWMDNTRHRNANHCLPMRMANQGGWLILNNSRVSMRANGPGNALTVDHIEFDYEDPVQAAAAARARVDCTGMVQGQPAFPHAFFGHGLVMWTLPFLFRTPPGWNLLIRGPANFPPDVVTPLEALVETDWWPNPFSFNWKFTHTGRWVTFEAGDPICMLVPQRRGDLEKFQPVIRSIDTDPELKASRMAWNAKRNAANAAYQPDELPAWTPDYHKGRRPDGTQAPQQHQTRLRLREAVTTSAARSNW